MTMKELLFSITKKDFKINWFSGTGAGGQGRNKLMNSCRLTHTPSNTMATGQSNKSRVANQKEALHGVLEHPVFKMWFNQQILEHLSGETVEEKVNRTLEPAHIKVECKDNRGRWTPMKEV